ncbi:hypothetical protein AB0M47_02460 [Hamadaea sp. NPDC051192]|uniref:hypothetical protein n=1 Tax=Hamadaea sp. NPDC051192 TaxID=3154940 RepID=UPI00342C14BD
MAQRMLSRALAVGVIASAILSAAGSAYAQDDKPSDPKKGCVIEYVDDNGKTIGKKTVPHGTQLGGGVFTCNNGVWEFFWIPFEMVVSGTADTVVVDVREQVKDVLGVQVDTREGQLQVREMLSAVEYLYGERADEPGGALVLDTAGREGDLTADELTALFDGGEVPGVRVLAAAKPGLETTLGELGELGGGDDGTGVTARKIAIQLGTSRYWFVGTVNCKKLPNGNQNCIINGTIVKR